MDSMEELSKFLDNTFRTDIRIVALREILRLTGGKEGLSKIQNDFNIIKQLFENVEDDDDNIRKRACLTLINISATEEGAKNLITVDLQEKKNILEKLLNLVLDPKSSAADAASIVLLNITRNSTYAELLVECFNKKIIKINHMVNAFAKINFNMKSCNLNYLGPLFTNLSQSKEFRRQVMNKNCYFIQKLLPFIHYADSFTRQSGIIAMVRNCCLEVDYHAWLLSAEVDILPELLLPLAGPEEFVDEEMEKLPLELQHLGKDKKRESNENMRKLLLEAINQLCATRFGREYLRSKNTYIILREYHKWEKNRNLLLVCENIIHILIRTEDEIGEDNLKNLTVPEDYIKKFEEMDKIYLEDD